MTNPGKSWTGALLLLAALGAPSESASSQAMLVRQQQTRALEAARVARAERLEQRHLECLAEQETLHAVVASKKELCDAEMQRFQECRAERRDLEGAELWGCGLGLAMGVASRLAAEPWKLTECGLADPPESRASCPVPACTTDASEIEREVLAERGATKMPEC